MIPSMLPVHRPEHPNNASMSSARVHLLAVAAITVRHRLEAAAAFAQGLRTESSGCTQEVQSCCCAGAWEGGCECFDVVAFKWLQQEIQTGSNRQCWKQVHVWPSSLWHFGGFFLSSTYPRPMLLNLQGGERLNISEMFSWKKTSHLI